MRRGKTRTLDLMSKSAASSRFVTAVLFLVVASVPIGIWIILFDAAPPGTSLEFLGYGLSSQNKSQAFFVFLLLAGVFSVVAATLVAFQHRRNVLRVVFAGGLVQSFGYLWAGLWPMAVFSAFPLWWVWRGQREV